MTRVVVIDHGAGNLVSIAQGLSRAGAQVDVVDNPSAIGDAAGIVLPGVGTTGAAMERLTSAGLVEPLRQWNRPLLGICVGLQLFFDHSEEDGTDALGIIPGRVQLLEGTPLLPHIGWNDVTFEPDPLFSGVAPDATFYFVHSFAGVPDDESVVIARTEYGKPSSRQPGRVTASVSNSIPSDQGQQGCRCWPTSSPSVRKPQMLRKRVIPCLDVTEGRVVKGSQLRQSDRRRRPGRTGRALRAGGSRRDLLSRHNRFQRQPRHHARRGASHRQSMSSCR